MEIEDCTVLRETERAILVRSEEFDEIEGEIDVWIPKSQIDDDSEVYKLKTEGTLIVTEWFAEQKGWL